MSGVLSYSISVQYVTNGKTHILQSVNQDQTLGDEYACNFFLAPFAGAVALPLAGVATPKKLYIRNLNDTNFVQILDGATVLLEVPALQQCLVDLPTIAGTLNVLADTADCLIDYMAIDA